ACIFETGGAVTCGNSNVVVGCLARNYQSCARTEVAIFSKLPEVWFNEKIEEATKKCRVYAGYKDMPPLRELGNDA
ncbi:unnamed protein product, partial [Allacma fusca]